MDGIIGAGTYREPRPRRSATRPRWQPRGLVALLIGLGLVLAGGAVTSAAVPAAAPPVGDPVEPTGLGDDPAFDALAEACFAGDLESCDDLYWRTEVGSSYEEYGSTCGGRLSDGVFGDCVDTLGSVPVDPVAIPEPTVEPAGLGTDEALNALADDCYAGAMFACDKLFVLGEEGSPYYTYGFTCAGRQDQETNTFCHELAGFPGPGVEFATLPTPDDDNVFTLIATCAIGDMQSCDDLYRQEDGTSPYLSLADTCAGRQPEGTGLLCVNSFPAWEQLLVGADGGATPRIDPVADIGEPTDPSGLGDDPTFAPLAEACFDGDLGSCDDLYFRTPIGSPYETYGTTCGGRVEERLDGSCAEMLEDAVAADDELPAPTIEPTGLGTYPAFDALAQDCYDGAMFACDRLYFDADSDTEAPYEDFADGCAGRQPMGTGLYCHELVGFPAPNVDVEALPTDDPELFLTASLCTIGDMVACDDIYRAVPDDSPYQEFADTCAGRQPTGTGRYCTTAFPEFERLYETGSSGASTTTVPGTVSGDVPPATQEPSGLGSDPAMDALARLCHQGAMQACDDLYQLSPVDSAYETYADTCAGRQPEGTGLFCTESFGS